MQRAEVPLDFLLLYVVISFQTMTVSVCVLFLPFFICSSLLMPLLLTSYHVCFTHFAIYALCHLHIVAYFHLPFLQQQNH